MFKKLIKFFNSLRTSDNSDYEHILRGVDEFKNRHIYKELTTDIIDRTEDDKLLQTVFDNLSEKVSWDDDTIYETLLAFSKQRRAIFVIWCLDGEVNNGGFNQLYFNSTGRFADLIPPALELVGANKCAELVSRANKTYEAEYSKITSYQDGTLDGFSNSYEENPLNEFDAIYYHLSESENLQRLQIDFIRNNKADFIDK